MENGEQPSEHESRVTPLELFFDLVFVFAITQLTSVLADDPTPIGALQVLLIFGVLWWMFGGYVWLTKAFTTRAPGWRAPWPPSQRFPSASRRAPASN